MQLLCLHEDSFLTQYCTYENKKHDHVLRLLAMLLCEAKSEPLLVYNGDSIADIDRFESGARDVP